MSELIPFSRIPSRWDWEYDNGPDVEYPYTDAQEEAAEFFSKMDWEGGIDGLMSYGGPDVFPTAVYEQALAYENALEALREAINAWAAEAGVEY